MTRRLLITLAAVLSYHADIAPLSAADRPRGERPRASRAQTFDSNGVTVSYSVQGEGEPVVLIHGWLSSGWINWDLPGTTQLLAADFQVITIDMPGHGLSEKSMNPEAYGLELVEDVVRLMDHLKIKKAHLVGYSMGGMITAKLLVKHPDRVLSATLGGMGWLREGGLEQKFFNSGRKATKAAGVCFQSLGKLSLTKEEIESIKVPVVVLFGDYDPLRKLYLEPLKEARKDWKVIDIERADHISCIFKPQFRNEIQKWLASQRARAE